MRDVNRIKPLLMDFSEVWEQCFPDMRFMQVIVNFQRWLGNDGFYLEDDKLIEKFCSYATEMMRE